MGVIVNYQYPGRFSLDLKASLNAGKVVQGFLNLGERNIQFQSDRYRGEGILRIVTPRKVQSDISQPLRSTPDLTPGGETGDG